MTSNLTRRAALKLILPFGAGVVAAACASPRQPPQATVPPAAPAAERPNPTLTPVLANSELVVGRNRFAMGLIGENSRPITDAQVTYSFFQISGQQATKKSEAQAVFRWVDLETKGIYAAGVSFDAPGRWGVEVAATRPGRSLEVARVPFEVREKGSAPMIGSAAPRSKTRTAREVADPAEICTNVPPCELHALSVDEALGNGRPTLILFATPGYCTSATCAPQLGVVLQLRARHAERANFVHVEIYKDPRNQVVADAVTEWNLPSEPWIFVVDRAGVIADRFEGTTTADEVEGALPGLL